MIVSDLSVGATMPHVTRATTPPGYSMHPTMKSGAMVSTAMPLSGMRQVANALTFVAGPKNAASHVRMYPECS